MFKVNILHGWLGVENEGVFNEYIEGEKRLLSLYEIAKENKNEDWQNMAKTWLSSLYEVKGSPVYDLEKSKYWKEKECLA